MKQTAIQWLLSELPHLDTELLKPIIEQAKAMEKEQIEKAYSNGRVDEQFKGTNASFYRTKSEQYFNKTFKSE